MGVSWRRSETTWEVSKQRKKKGNTPKLDCGCRKTRPLEEMEQGKKRVLILGLIDEIADQVYQKTNTFILMYLRCMLQSVFLHILRTHHAVRREEK